VEEIQCNLGILASTLSHHILYMIGGGLDKAATPGTNADLLSLVRDDQQRAGLSHE
jgi:hypothetical protein